MKSPARLLYAWCAFSAVVLPAVLIGSPDSVEAVGKAAAEWVKTRAETVRLQSEWSSQRQLLESTEHALVERAGSLEARRDELNARTSHEREELEKMEAGNQAITTGLQASEAQLKSLNDRLLRLRPSLPPRLSAALELPYRSLTNTELPLGERMQHTMTVLNRCVQFNRVVTHGDEVITLPGDSVAKSLEVIYWGLSHGYALDRAAGQAWLGSPGPQGWQWEPRPEAVQSVMALITIANDKAEPEFVTVPAQLRHTGAQPSRP